MAEYILVGGILILSIIYFWLRHNAKIPPSGGYLDPIDPYKVGNCPIREHTGDGDFIGRCDFAYYDSICPRHGNIFDYPNLDDRDLTVQQRRFRENNQS